MTKVYGHPSFCFWGRGGLQNMTDVFSAFGISCCLLWKLQIHLVFFKWLQKFMNNASLFSRKIIEQGSGYRMGTGQLTEVQEQCKQHMPTEGATEHWAAEGACGREVATPALNMGKFGERGEQVKKSQQESSLDDRRNLISKIHKSSSEGRRIMGTMEASVSVNTVLLLAIKWIRPSC